MQLETLLKQVAIMYSGIPKEKRMLEITKVTQDSRQVIPDSLFVAIEGAQFDGHNVLEAAVLSGAQVLVVEKEPADKTLPYLLVRDTKKALAQLATAFYQNPSQHMKVIGVTGTNGKTTITHLIDQLLSLKDQQTGMIGTMYNKIAGEQLPTVNTTPDSLTLQQLFSQMRSKEVTVCAMEVSSHGLVNGRTWGVDFDVAVFSNFSQDHLDFHETMADYFNAKALLFAQLGNTYQENKKLAVINCDDEKGAILSHYTAQNVLTYGYSKQADLRVSQSQVTSKGTQFTLHYQNRTYPVNTQLIGDFNIYNILAALGACMGVGYGLEELLDLVATLQPVRGRFQLVENTKGAIAIVDYAHTPDGLYNILTTAKKIAKKRIFCVVGCGGDRDKSKRPVMAAIALEHCDYAIFTSDNPRTENPEKILDDMCGQLTQTNFEKITDRKVAIEQALSLADVDDLIVVAGKGHEDYQVVGTQKNYFDDSAVIKNFVMKESV